MRILKHVPLVFFATFLSVVSVSLPPAEAHVPREIASFVEIRDAEPEFAEILKAYLRRERLDGRGFASWKRRIRTAPLLPTLYAGYDQQIKRNASASITDNTSISGGIVTVGPEDNDYDFDNGLGRSVHVRAVWDLSETVFNRYEFAAVSARQRDAQLRSRAEADLYKIYEARHLYLAQFLMSRSRPEKAAVAYARYLELTARLDALTGGAFAGLFWKAAKTGAGNK